MLGSYHAGISTTASFLAVLLALGCAAENTAGGEPGRETNGSAGAGSNGSGFYGEQVIADNDQNADGVLSFAEAPMDIKKGFEQIDIDRDGYLTAAEIDRAGQHISGGSGSVAEIDRAGQHIPGGSGSVPGVGLSEFDICASKDITTKPGIPKVDLVVDRSGSMKKPATYASRWVEASDAVRELVFPLTSQVAFGYHGYTYNDGPCPELIEVPAATNNADRIYQTMVNSPRPKGKTPTGETLNAVVDQIVQERSNGDNSARTIVLITDGRPNGCDQGRDYGAASTEAAAARICNENIRLYVIWIGDLSDADIRAHMQRVADLGAGACKDPSQQGTFHTVTGGQELQNVLTQVVTGVMECVLQLDGKGVDPDTACSDPRSTVTISGQALVCGDPNGYRLTGSTTLEFLGEACNRLQSDENLIISATFPCEVFLE